MSKIFLKVLILFSCFECTMWGFLSSCEGQEVWSNLGLYGGQINEIAIDPENPNKMFAGAYMGDGLFLTENGGKTWMPVLTAEEGGELEGEATFRNTAVWAVSIAPGNHDVVWATHNYWAEISRDGGLNWAHVMNRTMQRDCANCGGEEDDFRYTTALAIDPNDASTVYVGTGGPDSGGSNGTVYKTTNGGSSWIKMGMVGPFHVEGLCDYSTDLKHEFYSTVVAIEIHPSHSNIVWVLDYSDNLGCRIGFLYLSLDGGQTWQWQVGVEAHIGETGLVIKPNEPNVLFVASFKGIVRLEYPINSESGEVEWKKKPTVSYPIGWAGEKNVRALTFDPQDPNILYAALGSANNFRLIKSTNGGLNFDETYYHQQQFINLAVHPKVRDVIFGGDRLCGVFRGTFTPYQNDYVWIPINNGISAVRVNDIAIDPHDSSHILAATSSGVYQRGKTGIWTPTEGLRYTEAFSVAFDPKGKDGITFYAGIESYLTKTIDGGNQWIYSNSLGYPHFVNSIAIDPNNRSTLFVTTRYPGSVWKGVDSGSKLELKKVLPNDGVDTNFDFNTVVIDPSDSKRVFAGGGNYFSTAIPGKLYDSSDGGSNWSVSLSNVTVNALLIDPDDPATIYSGCGSSGGTNVPLYKSTDGGQSWMPSYRGMPGAPSRHGIWGSAANDIFVLGFTGSVVKGGSLANRILQFDGIRWEKIDVGVSSRLRDLWGTSPYDVFAVGDGGIIVHFDGNQWEEMTSGTTEDLLGIWGASKSHIFAVGKSGTVLHYNGSDWVPMESKTAQDLCAVWGTADHANVYAVGAHGTIIRYDQTAWSEMVSGVNTRLEAVWGTPDGAHIYAVGNSVWDRDHYEYTILHYLSSGGGWRLTNNLPRTTCPKLWDLWASSWNDVYAVGEGGVILHFNGINWSEKFSGTPLALYAIWGNSSDGVYAAGEHGILLTGNASSWRKIDTSPHDVLPWNAVTDLKLKMEGEQRFIYASSSRQGIYVSANQGGKWGSLLAPPHEVYAVGLGSVNVATNGGAFTAGSIGVLFGCVKDKANRKPVDQVEISTAWGISDTTDIDGVYCIRLNAGTYRLETRHDAYAPDWVENVRVHGAGSCTVAHFSLIPINTRPAAMPWLELLLFKD